MLLDAGIAYCAGRRDAAISSLRAAAEELRSADMHLLAQVAQRRLGEVLGGASGAAIVREADTALAVRGIRNAPRVAGLFAPGFDEPSKMLGRAKR